MVGISESTTITLSIPIPKPVIIFNGMKLQDWKEHFIMLKNQTLGSKEKISYSKCIKTLLWAEFCNGSLVYIGNEKKAHSYYGTTVKMTFDFPNFSCRNLFWYDLGKNIDIVTDL